MVQLLVTVLCRKASKRRSRYHGVSDDPFKLAAGLRMLKSEKAFCDMAEDFEHYIDQLDDGASMNKFFVIYGAVTRWTDVVPGLPVKMKHLSKRELARDLDVMNLTLGNRRKARERAKAREAQIAKAKGRWSVLSTLLTPEEATDEGSAIARKLRSVMRGGRKLRTMPPIANVATVLLQKQKEERKDGLFTLDESKSQNQEHKTAAAVMTVAKDLVTAKREAVEEKAPNSPWTTSIIRRDSDIAAHPKKKRMSASLTLLTKEARKSFHVNEEDSLMKRVAKLSLLEDEFATLTTTPKELKRLWNDADSNGNGDLSLSEWQGYAGTKFNVLSSSRANKRAFSEAASAGPSTAASHAATSTSPKKGGGKDGAAVAAADAKDGKSPPAAAAAPTAAPATAASATKPTQWKESLGGLSMPILNRSNFSKFIQRTFEYSKCHYAFEYLEQGSEKKDDRVSFEEYTRRRKIAFQILDIDIGMAGSTLQEEFDTLCVDPTDGLDEGSAAEKFVERTIETKWEPFISFRSLSAWYRRAMDSKIGGRFREESNPNLVEQEDATGLLVDIDVFCDLVLQCHYKTRSAGGSTEDIMYAREAMERGGGCALKIR